ncbi:hypothetical protein [Pacificoceanicola onchidii]|uniref:hypothetical protein n=1 Tax=Pacificoceanicola onchidii TaxID=2562685 RepID=UPI0010A65662|nr:hypothetical protein [Pacificoceanicola onchidii]
MARKTRKRTKQTETAQGAKGLSRRALVLGPAGLLVLGGAGWWGSSAVSRTQHEHDLSRIGNGLPSVVQIHDPLCNQCTQLQRNTRKALTCFEDGSLQYVIANIRTEDGAAFANGLGLPHVTLVLMDGQGSVQDVLQGVRSREELKPAFQAFQARA